MVCFLEQSPLPCFCTLRNSIMKGTESMDEEFDDVELASNVESYQRRKVVTR